MARLEDMLPPGEIVRWRSPKDRTYWRIFGWGVLTGAGAAWLAILLKEATEPGLLLAAAIGMAGFGLVMVLIRGYDRAATAKLAVTETHIVWVDGIGGDGNGKAALREVDVIETEEGDATLNLQLPGETRRIEEIVGDVEDAVRAAGRPARIWRECRSRGAVLARRWGLCVGAVAAGFFTAGNLGLLFLVFGAGSFKGFGGAMVIVGAGLPAQWLAGIAHRTLPHFLVGRRLRGEDRRDFVGWMTDPRWRGVKPDGPDDKGPPRSRLQDWAMRKAYGEIPDIGERQPEVLIPVQFPTE